MSGAFIRGPAQTLVNRGMSGSLKTNGAQRKWKEAQTFSSWRARSSPDWALFHLSANSSCCVLTWPPPPRRLQNRESLPVEFYMSLQAAVFVSEEHKRAVWGKPGAEAAPSSLCPHCEAFKGFQWVLEDTRGRDNSVPKKPKAQWLSQFVHNDTVSRIFFGVFTFLHGARLKLRWGESGKVKHSGGRLGGRGGGLFVRSPSFRVHSDKPDKGRPSNRSRYTLCLCVWVHGGEWGTDKERPWREKSFLFFFNFYFA